MWCFDLYFSSSSVRLRFAGSFHISTKATDSIISICLWETVGSAEPKKLAVGGMYIGLLVSWGLFTGISIRKGLLISLM